MDHRAPMTINGVDLRDKTARQELRFRDDPYWTIISRGCHVGYRAAHGGDPAHWYARIHNRYRNRFRHLLGVADDHAEADGIRVLNFDQAKDATVIWFERNTGSQRRNVKPRVEHEAGLVYYPIGTEYTVVRAIVDYLEWKRIEAAPSHYVILESLINCYILPHIGAMLVDEIRAKHINRLARFIIENPTRPVEGIEKIPTRIAEMNEETLRRRRKSANAVLSILKQAFVMAWEDEKTNNQRSWVACRTFKRVSSGRMLHLSRSEARRLLHHCPDRFRELVLGALYTGCRAGELIALNAEDVARDGYGIYVRPGKTNRARFVFLPDEGMVFFLKLAEGKAPGDPLFPNPIGIRWGTREYIREMARASKLAEMPVRMCFHVLRHTYASQLIQAGAPFIAVSEQLGHKNAITVMRTYGHLSPQIREAEVRQRFTTLDRSLAAQAERQQDFLKEWRESLHGTGNDSYATINDLSSVQRSLQ